MHGLEELRAFGIRLLLKVGWYSVKLEGLHIRWTTVVIVLKMRLPLRVILLPRKAVFFVIHEGHGGLYGAVYHRFEQAVTCGEVLGLCVDTVLEGGELV